MRIEIPRYDRVIGLPDNGQAIVISNSERSESACPKRWWFSQVERLGYASTAPQRYGTMWHACIEEVHRWWAAADTTWPHDAWAVCPFCAGGGLDRSGARDWSREGGPTALCPRCGGSGQGILMRLHTQALARLVEASRMDPESRQRKWSPTREEIDEMSDTLTRAFGGWIRKYGADPYDNCKVVAIETALAREIRNPRNGAAYCPETYVVKVATGLRMATTGDAVPGNLAEGEELLSVRWPYFQVGILDAILQHRRTGVLYCGEWKSSADPRGLVADLSVDPQTAGYCWLLSEPTTLARFKAERAAGFLFDVASSSYQYDPEPLKGKPTKKEPNPPFKFSQARNKTIPSWRYRAAVQAMNLPADEYAETIMYFAQHVDPRLYIREPGTCSPEGLERYGAEVYAEAVKFAAWRRAAARIVDEVDVAVAFPRNAVCRLPGGYCAFRGPCLQDGEDVRRDFDIGKPIVWSTAPRIPDSQEVLKWR